MSAHVTTTIRCNDDYYYVDVDDDDDSSALGRHWKFPADHGAAATERRGREHQGPPGLHRAPLRAVENCLESMDGIFINEYTISLLDDNVR
jgi:hypothetical protein